MKVIEPCLITCFEEADVAEPGRVLGIGEIKIIRGSEYYFPVSNAKTRDYTIRVYALSHSKQPGPYAEVVVRSPGLRFSTPSDVKVSVANDGHGAVVEWSFDSEIKSVRGFRVWVNDQLIADETKLDSKTRKFIFNPVVPNEEYFFQVQAISKNRIESAKTLEKSFTLTAAALRPTRPADLKAKWNEGDNGKATIDVTWGKRKSSSGNINAWLISANLDNVDKFVKVAEVSKSKPLKCTIPGVASQRGYVVRVAGVNAQGTVGPHAEVYCGPDSAALPVPRLIAGIKVPVNGGVGVKWVWKCGRKELVSGYRIYMDDKLVADETTLDSKATEWTSGPLEEQKFYRFQIASVSSDEDTDTADKDKLLKVSELSAKKLFVAQ